MSLTPASSSGGISALVSLDKDHDDEEINISASSVSTNSPEESAENDMDEKDEGMGIDKNEVDDMRIEQEENEMNDMDKKEDEDMRIEDEGSCSEKMEVVVEDGGSCSGSGVLRAELRARIKDGVKLKEAVSGQKPQMKNVEMCDGKKKGGNKKKSMNSRKTRKEAAASCLLCEGEQDDDFGDERQLVATHYGFFA